MPVLPSIEEGRVQFTLASVDSESWLATWKNGHDQAEMHRAYERYVIGHSFIKHKTGWFDGMMTTGCSMGAYHALNFFLNIRCLYQGDCPQWCLRRVSSLAITTTTMQFTKTHQ